jgi:hypothetical protein
VLPLPRRRLRPRPATPPLAPELDSIPELIIVSLIHGGLAADPLPSSISSPAARAKPSKPLLTTGLMRFQPSRVSSGVSRFWLTGPWDRRHSNVVACVQESGVIVRRRRYHCHHGTCRTARARGRMGAHDFDPLRRLRRTGLAAMGTVYGARSVAETMIARVRRMHDTVAGTTLSGEPYTANDPELLNWVYATAAYGFVEAYHTYVQPLSSVERSSSYAGFGRF